MDLHTVYWFVGKCIIINQFYLSTNLFDLFKCNLHFLQIPYIYILFVRLRESYFVMNTNEEFNKLMRLKKHFLINAFSLPEVNNDLVLPVGAIESKEIFSIDLSRKSTIILTRKKFQERLLPTNDLMVRLEIDSKPHMNPDGTLISKNHIHIFREKYNLSWAYELDQFDDILFKNTDDFDTVFYDFCRFCNISTDNINIQGVI